MTDTIPCGGGCGTAVPLTPKRLAALARDPRRRTYCSLGCYRRRGLRAPAAVPVTRACGNPACGRPVSRQASAVRGAVHCDRRCFYAARGIDPDLPVHVLVPCSRCGAQVRRKRRMVFAHTFCTAVCRRAWSAARRRTVTRPCRGCGTPVTRPHRDSARSWVWCSTPCRRRHGWRSGRTGTTKPCTGCGKPTYRKPYYTRETRYCSHACARTPR